MSLRRASRASKASHRHPPGRDAGESEHKRGTQLNPTHRKSLKNTTEMAHRKPSMAPSEPLRKKSTASMALPEPSRRKSSAATHDATSVEGKPTSASNVGAVVSADDKLNPSGPSPLNMSGFSGPPKSGDVRGLYSSSSFYRGKEKPWYRKHLTLLVVLTALVLSVSSLTLLLLMFRESVSTIIGSKAPPVSACDQKTVPIVLKSLGVELRGRQSHLGSVHTYFGIPYAASTGGANRFQLPKNTTGIGAVDKVFYAHQHGPRCPQDRATLQNSSEDCLTLSIWTPPRCSKFDPPFVVIVVLSSDWFQRGYAKEDESTWDALASSGRLIVVFVQHRLGVLGFLDAGVEDSPGNQGIEDAFLALDWISENIEAFNGDPNSLVGLGHGSGSYITSLDLFAATWRRRRFFKRLILLGLTPTSLLPRGGSGSFGSLVQRLKCDKDDNVSASIACLREVPLEKMFEETVKEAPLTFMPSCGKPPIGDCGNASVELPDVFLHKEMLCGFDQEDGRRLLEGFVLQELPASNDPSTAFDRLQRFFTRKEPKQKFSSLSPDTQKALNQSYLQGLRDLVVDMVLRCPLLRLARAAVLKGSRMYLYASEGPNRVFEPALTKEDITDFAKNGKANWRAFNEHSSVLVVTASSHIVMEWGEGVCALANNLTLTIFS